MYAADLYFWRCCRVNYPFIFGSKRGTELGWQEVFLLGAGFAVLASASFLANLYLDRDPSTQKYRTEAEKVPLGTTAVRSLKHRELLLTTFYYFHECNIVSLFPFCQTTEQNASLCNILFLVVSSFVQLILLIAFCPFNILYKSSRFFFIRCILRCISAPLCKVIK